MAVGMPFRDPDNSQFPPPDADDVVVDDIIFNNFNRLSLILFATRGTTDINMNTFLLFYVVSNAFNGLSALACFCNNKKRSEKPCKTRCFDDNELTKLLRH